MSLFRLIGDGSEAARVSVRLGRVSSHAIEVISGLDAGDRVVLSDLSEWDGHDRIRIR